MKNKKIINVMLTVILLMVGMTFAVNAEASGDYEYKILNDGTISITKFVGEESIVEIPSEIDGLTVTQIGAEAFKSCEFLASVSIPDTVIDLGSEAFAECVNLTKLHVGDGITMIYDDVFYRTNNVEEVFIGKNLESVGVFYFFTNLKTITVDIENIRFVSEDNVLFNTAGTTLYKYPAQSDRTEYTVPESVERIEHNAFYKAVNLEKINLSASLKDIGEYAFLGCSALKSISIPKGVIELYSGAFANCKSLESVALTYNLRTINEEVFAGCENIKDVYYNEGENFWNRIAILPGNESLKEATIHYNTAGPDAVVDSGKCGDSDSDIKWELYGNGNLIISGSGKIKDGAHWNKYSQPHYNNAVKSVEISEGITAIGNSNFYDMSAIESVKIPDSVKTIGKKAFDSCYRVNEIILPENLEAIGEKAFASCGIKEITIPKGIKIIETRTFFNCQNLETVVLNEGLETIGNSAFMMCYKLKSVEFPSTLTKIDNGAFSNSTIEKAVLPESVKFIGAGAFQYCELLTEIYIPGEGVTMYTDSFLSGYNLTDVYIGKNVKFIRGEEETPFYQFSAPFVEYIFLEDSYEKYIENNLDMRLRDDMYKKVRFESSLVKDHDHSFVAYKTEEADCAKAGKIYCSCECGSTCVEYIKTIPHLYEKEIVKATFDKNGNSKDVCKYCGNVTNEQIHYRPKTIKLLTTKYNYDGKTKKPEVYVEDATRSELKENTDYTVKYESGRKNPGKYTVTVTFKGNYEGEKTLYFSILPSKTSSITATQSTSAIKLTWKKVTGATGYRVYQYNSKTGKYKTLKTLTGTSYTVKNLKAGTTYKFAVKAYTKDGSETLWAASSKTITTCTKPATPTVKATAGSGKATLSWSKVTGATGYVIYMENSFGDFEKVTSTTKTSYTKKSLKKGKTYKFRVKAYKKVDGKYIYSGYKTYSVKVK